MFYAILLLFLAGLGLPLVTFILNFESLVSIGSLNRTCLVSTVLTELVLIFDFFRTVGLVCPEVSLFSFLSHFGSKLGKSFKILSVVFDFEF